MKKISNKKIRKTTKAKRKIRFEAAATIIFMISSLFYVCSSLFLRSYNNSLSTKAQEISAEIVTLQTQNDAMQVDINTLSKRDRVNQIAEEDGMTSDSNNVISISITSSSEE